MGDPPQRKRPFDHYNGEPGQPHKKFRGQDFNSQRAGFVYAPQNRNGDTRQKNNNRQKWNNNDAAQFRRDKPNYTLEAIQSQPDPADCVPCTARAEEMQSGLIALLDHFVQEEMGPEGDTDIIHHARELHTLLSARAGKSSKASLELDKKRPTTAKHVLVPTYIAKKISQASNLPPLPRITEPHLQEAVFIHRSFDKGPRVANAKEWNYEKLEFLGDAYLEVIASRLIYSRFPHLEPGPQSHLRESLVKNETLQQFAEGYGLGDRIRHTGHIDKDKKAWLKIEADVFEAYIAAIVLSDPETGFDTVEQWLTELWAPQLLAHKEKPVQDPSAFDTLHKKLGAKNIKLDYREERPMEMRSGVQNFFLGVYLTGWGYEDEWLGSGEGQNKSQAKQAAAADALHRSITLIEKCYAKKQEEAALRLREKEKEEGAISAVDFGGNQDLTMSKASDNRQDLPGSDHDDAISALAKTGRRMREEEVNGTAELKRMKKKFNENKEKQKQGQTSSEIDGS